MKISEKILSELIDRYENRKEGSKRRVIIPANWFEDYKLDDVKSKKVFHMSVMALAELGFVNYEWMKFEKDNLLERIILVEDEIHEAYEWLGRLSTDDRISIWKEDILNLMKGLQEDWIRDFLADALRRVDEDGKLLAQIPGEPDQRAQFFSLLEVIDQGIMMNQRYLSARLYGDSKVFEKLYRGKLVSAAKRYIGLDWEAEQVLEYIGISSNPDEILMKGNIVYKLCTTAIDTGVHIYGTSINASTIDAMIIESVDAKRVMTIENKATYYEYIKKSSPEELVIYLGGFFGRATRKFLQMLRDAIDEENVFMHWGDVDLGGLQIYAYLCEVLGLRVIPFKMDEVTYERYCAEDYKLTSSQRKKIESLRSELCMKPLMAKIDVLLSKGYRLEQERIPIEYIRGSESPIESVNR